MTLAGRTALITGASGGIGSAVARAFAAAGADLSLADLKPVAPLADELRAGGRRVIDTPTDVTQASQVKALVDATVKSFGRIDVLANVAGTISFGSAEALFWHSLSSSESRPVVAPGVRCSACSSSSPPSGRRHTLASAHPARTRDRPRC